MTSLSCVCEAEWKNQRWENEEELSELVDDREKHLHIKIAVPSAKCGLDRRQKRVRVDEDT